MVIRAADERERREWLRHAWFTSILLAPHRRGRMISPMKLIPEIMRPEKPKKTKAEALAELAELRKELKIK